MHRLAPVVSRSRPDCLGITSIYLQGIDSAEGLASAKPPEVIDWLTPVLQVLRNYTERGA